MKGVINIINWFWSMLCRMVYRLGGLGFKAGLHATHNPFAYGLSNVSTSGTDEFTTFIHKTKRFNLERTPKMMLASEWYRGFGNAAWKWMNRPKS